MTGMSWDSEGTVETVLLMSQQKPNDTIHVGIDLKPEDVTVAESKATYAELQAYIEEKYGFKVSNLYIAQAKAALGIKERENYNKPRTQNGTGINHRIPAGAENVQLPFAKDADWQRDIFLHVFFHLLRKAADNRAKDILRMKYLRSF